MLALLARAGDNHAQITFVSADSKLINSASPKVYGSTP